MDKKEAKKRIEKLRTVIRHHRYLYHVKDKQEISPETLDSLKKELADLEKKFPSLVTSDSPTERVAGEPLDKFEKVDHPFPMLSINDAFNREDMEEWEERNFKLLNEEERRRVRYFCELKFDGLALELIYRNGVFLAGATRGDGETGEDVTRNAKTIEAIPLKLRSGEELGFSPDQREVVVRGEVLIKKEDFEKINKRQEKKGESTYANPRNLAAGSVRQLDPKITARRSLDFYAYEVTSDVGQKNHREEHEILKILGFKVSAMSKVCSGLDEVFTFFEKVKEKREGFPYEIDGVVVLVNQNGIFEKLGRVGKGPRGVIALKFPLKRATTRIRDIKVQVGRTGILTPVAVLEPVEVGGVTVTRATLHNQDEIERLGVKVGDTAVVGRAGDVIPEVVEVLPDLRSGGEKDFSMPRKCPVCGHRVEREEGGVLLRCPNPDCPSKKRKSLYHFVSKGAFDIQGLGPKLLDKLLDENLIQTPADLFTLKEGDLLPLENFKEKASSNLVRSIQESKKISFSRFLYALGIPQVGEETAFLLAREFGSIEKVAEASKEELEEVKGIGPKVAESIRSWFSKERNMQLVKDLKKQGVEIKTPKRKKAFEGKTFVFTGSLDSMTREEARTKVRSLGGDPNSSVSGETNFVVVGKNPGSKLEEAKKAGVELLSEKEFLEKIEDES